MRRRIHRRQFGRGICVSTVVHVVLLGALVWREIPALDVPVAPPSWDRPIELELTLAEERPHENPAVAIRPAPPRTEDPAPASPSRVAADLPEVRELFDGRLPEPAGDLETFVRQGVQRAADAASDRPEEDLLERLDKLGGTLSSVSSDERVRDLSRQFGDWLDTTGRATEPAGEPVAGRFDADTAQIHDVLREAEPDGRIRYFATLVDASGRTERVPLDGPDGERLYKTISLIKKHPLLEAVYRDVVMAFLDKLANTAASSL